VWSVHAAELSCPACPERPDGAAGLQLQAADGWVEQGSLSCPTCGSRYPIEAGVPSLFAPRAGNGGGTQVDSRTQAAFGFEWLRYPVTSEAEDQFTLVGLTGIEPAFYQRVKFRNLFAHMPADADLAAASTSSLAGKRVMEAGCGMGKYVRVVARAGARLAVGLDASESVRRAAAVNRDLRNALIVRGDIFRPPLKGGFDLAYSVGVLHHTPDAHQAFLSTARLVRPGGEMAVWLYPHARDPLRQSIEWCHERVLRPMTSRLPHGALEKLCASLGKLTALKTRLRERGGAGREALARLLNLVAVGEHLDPQIAAFLNFDWYSPPYRSRHTEEELSAWFREAGFETPRLLPERVSAIGRRC
jgi:SAM-dependent methyltransferase/uncharacterized protein YbaR (Trm112 family)